MDRVMVMDAIQFSRFIWRGDKSFPAYPFSECIDRAVAERQPIAIILAKVEMVGSGIVLVRRLSGDAFPLINSISGYLCCSGRTQPGMLIYLLSSAVILRTLRSHLL